MDRTIATMAEDIGLFDIVRKTATNVDSIVLEWKLLDLRIR